MNEFQIETAQNISINQNAANVLDRILAFLVDTLVLVAYTIGVIILLQYIDLDMADSWSIYLVATLPVFLYYFLVELFTDGKTIGKSLLKIRVVRLDGGKPSFAHYLIRWILRIVDISMTTGGVAILTILLRGKGQRLGDIAAGTTVISEKVKVTLANTLIADIPDDYIPQFSQVTVFKDREIQHIKEMYYAAKRNGNHKVVLKLSEKIKEVTGIQTDLNAMEFVDIVIKDYNYYTQKL